MSQYPYEQQPVQPYYPEQPYGGQPQQGYPPQPYAEAPQPAYPPQGYPQPAYYPPPAPVQVNVNQYAGPVVVARRRVNHKLHFWLTLFTGGLWAPVWIMQARKANAVYR